MDKVNSSGDVTNSVGAVYDGTLQQMRDQHHHYYATAPAVIPRMQPTAPATLVNRGALLDWLDQQKEDLHERRAPRVAWVTGGVFVGKTGAVSHWIADRERAAEREGRDWFPRGTLYAPLSPRGLHHLPEPGDILATFLRELGVRAEEFPNSLEERASCFRSRTRQQPVLVFLDGAVSQQSIRHLLPGHPESLVVVTSRDEPLAWQVGDLDLSTYRMARLEEDFCTELFLHTLGPSTHLTEEEREAMRAVISQCEGLPQMVKMAGACASAAYYGGIVPFSREVERHRSMLRALEEEDISLDPQLDLSYERLDALSASVFRALGVHPGQEVPHDLVRHLADGRNQVARGLLRLHLLEEAGTDRYRLNAVLHDYASSLATEEDRTRVVAVLVRWYLSRVAATERWLSQRWCLGPTLREKEKLSGIFESREQALGALEADRDNLAGVIELAHDNGHFHSVVEFAEGLRGFCERRQQHGLWIRVGGLAVSAAEHISDRLWLARAHFELAFAHGNRWLEEDREAAYHHYQRSLEIAERIGHARTRSSVLEGLGLLALKEDDPARAQTLLTEAEDALEGVDHARGRALLSLHRGTAALRGRDPERAAALYQEARARFAELRGEDYNQGKCQLRYAQARLEQGQVEEALTALDGALERLSPRAAGMDRAKALCEQGRALRLLGRDPQESWTSALVLYQGLRSEVGVSEVRALLDEGDQPER
ncbi:NB-ARC domain-containing protein [Streptomyces sp. NPDC005438]|uniref:NB-ARC domain-containing protein n=1 Tax=Streptomyces sp. NPDC005438 TaxID=3156880 RepID=UPI0033A37477